jgi:hypothetical protein
MPQHIHPVFRAREVAAESAKLIKTLDSKGLTVKAAQESAGKNTKVVPKKYIQVGVKGTNYTAT